MAGNNDLSMLLKSEVVKLRAELDKKGSLPKIKKQIKEMSTSLEKNPLKLAVELDATISKLNREVRALKTKMESSKTFKPLKIKVDIDVAGSASNIKKQLQDIYKTVGDFNKKYGTQVEKMNKTLSGAGKTGSKTGMFAGFDAGKMVQGINQVKTAMNETFGKGLFSTHEFKDAEGNLQGFVAQLQQANGVVQKIRYEWDSEKNSFSPINQQTINTLEKNVDRAGTALRKMYSDIDKMDDGLGKSNLLKQYEELEKKVNSGTITQKAVEGLRLQIKEENILQSQISKTNNDYIDREKLILSITKSQRKMQSDLTGDKSYDSSIKASIQDLENLKNAIKSSDTANVKKYRNEIDKIVNSNNDYVKSEKEVISEKKRRLDIFKRINSLEKNSYADDGKTKRLLEQARAMANNAKTGRDYLKVEEQLQAIVKRTDFRTNRVQSMKLENQLLKELDRYTRVYSSSAQERLELEKQIKVVVGQANKDGGNSARALLERLRLQTQKYNSEMRKRIENEKILIDLSGKKTQATALDIYKYNNISNAVNAKDVDTLKKYIGQLYKGKVETISLTTEQDKFGRTIDKIGVKMAGKGKEIETYNLQLDRNAKKLAQSGSAIEHNVNRNLGVMEQLKIAMARVPVWMSAMTLFYGTLRSVRNMTREILKVDKAMTELRRVLSEDLDPDNIFTSTMELSKELGNNVHDVMQTMNDFARTFGDFNESQLLAITNTATLMANVSDLSAQDSGQALISTMNAFNISAEESVRIVDSMNEVDNNFAVSTQQLAKGMSKSASVAKTFGVEMEESLGHITAISTLTGETGEVLGNSLKTIYSRLTTMEGAESALNNVGVAVKDSAGEAREAQDILEDLGETWHTLTDAEKQNIGVKAAGRYQLSRFLALMNNWHIATEATSSALTSQGSAIRENEAYMESFEAKINKLKNIFTEFSLAIGDAVLSSSLNLIIDGLTTLGNVGIKFVENNGVLPLVIGLLGGVAGASTSMRTSIFNAISTFKGFRVSLKDVTKDLKGMEKAKASVDQVTMSLGQMAGAKTKGLLKGLGAGLVSLGASLALSATFFAVGKAVEFFVGKLEEQREIQRKVKESNDKLVDSYRNTEGGLDSLVDKYNTLNGRVQRGLIQEGTDEYEEYLEINNELADRMPNMVKFVDEKGQAHLREASALKDNVKYAEELSEAYANLTLEQYEQDVKELYDNIENSVSKIDELYNTIDRLKEMDGQTETINVTGSYGYTQEVTWDTGEGVQKRTIEAIVAQQELESLLQDSADLARSVTLSSLEASGHLGQMSANSVNAVETLISSNSGILREIARNEDLTVEEREEAFNSAVARLVTTGEEFGKHLSEKTREYTDKITDDEDLKKFNDTLTSVYNNLPDSFFEFDGDDEQENIDRITKSMDGLLEVTNMVSENSIGSFDDLTGDLEKLGFTSGEAERLAVNLTNEMGNQALRADMLAKEVDGELNESLDDYIEKTVQAIEVSEALFGFNSEETKNIKEHLEMLVALRQLNKENTTAWQDSVRELAVFFGVTDDYVEDNISGLREMFTLMESWSPQFDEEGKLTEDARKQFNQIEALAEEYDIELSINADTDEIKINTEEIEKNNEAKDKSKEKTDELKSSVEDLNTKLNTFIESGNTEDEMVYFNTLKNQLARIDEDLKFVQDEAGNFKLVMADGSENPLLTAMEEQLEKVNGKIEVVKTDAGNLKLAFMRDGEITFIQDLGGELEDLNVGVDDVKENIRTVGEEELELAMNYDVEKVLGDLTATKLSLEDLDRTFGQIEGKVSKLEEIGTALKDMFSNILDSVASLFSDSKGDIDELRESAINAQSAVNDLEDALKDIKNLASRIDRKGIDKLKDSVEKADDKVKDLKKSLEKLDVEKIVNFRDKFNDMADKSSKSFEDMKSGVSRNTNSMITKHKQQVNVIDKIRRSANDAKTAVINMNTSARNAMSTLDTYITKANRAISAGNRVPSTPSTGVFGGIRNFFMGRGIGQESGSVGALSGESGTSGSGGSGTSGTISQSVYVGGTNLDGDYQFSAYADELSDLFTYNKEERQASALNSNIGKIEARMNAMTEGTLKYRNALKQVVTEEQRLLAVQKKDLSNTKNRQKAIERQLSSLKNTSKHTKAQRDKYNDLMREYESNISKIQSLEKEVIDVTNSIKEKTTQMFEDWVAEITTNYEKIVTGIKDKTDDIEFEIEVAGLVDPDNIKKELSLLGERANSLRKEQATTKNMVSDLQKMYNDAVKKYGKSSKEAKNVEEKLRDAKESLEDITISVLNAEKNILDVRGSVADRGIEKLKSYYSQMQTMAQQAIDFERKELEKAHKSKMDKYDEEISKINAVYDEKLKKIDQEKNEEEFKEQLNEKNAKKADLTNKISILSRDTSLEGRKKLAEMQTELTNLNAEIVDMTKNRQDELFIQSINTQREEQIAKFETEKAFEEASYNSKLEKLEQESIAVNAFYEKMINDEQRWSEMRNQFIQGNFSTLNGELETMNQRLEEMANGNFNSIGENFANLSSEIKKEFENMFNLDVKNLTFELEGILKNIRDAEEVKYKAYTGSGSTASKPSQTTAKSSTGSSGSSSSSKPKPAPSPRYHTIKKGDTMWDLANKYYGNSLQWKKIAEANSKIDPRRLQVGKKLLIPFRSGGYTGEWAGDDGRIAMLHKKELVLNENQTKNILDTAKIMDKVKNILPKVSTSNHMDKLQTAGSISTVTYGDIIVNVHGADKKSEKNIAREILKEVKKSGR